VDVKLRLAIGVAVVIGYSAAGRVVEVDSGTIGRSSSSRIKV
jgi:hypothetical protein